MKFESLEDYYRNQKIEDIFLPENPQFRQWKFFVGDSVIKIRKKIRTKEQLKKLLLKYLPEHVYYSTSEFLNPYRIKFKKRIKGFEIETAMINADLFAIDIDSEKPTTIENLEKIRKEAVKIYDYLKRKNYKIIYCAYSGNGIHILIKNNLNLPVKISERVEFVENERKKLVKELKDKHFSFDENTTLDSYRVIRLPNTPNMKNGIVSKLLTEKELRLPFKEIIKKVNYIGKMLGIPEKERDTGCLIRQEENERANIISSPFYIQFATSKVGKLKRFVLFLKYNKKLEYIEKDLKRLQRIYNLSDFYILKSEREFPVYYAICLKTMQLRRMKKIINNSTSIDNNKFKMYYLPISDMILLNGEIYRKKPEYVKMVKSENKKIDISSSHSILLKNIFGIPIKNYSTHSGDGLLIRTYRGILNG